MKKVFFAFVLFTLAFTFTSCNSCSKEETNGVTLGATEDVLNVERVVSADREYMFANYGSSYVWYETCILLKDYMDDENFDGEISGISNVFQYIEKCSDTTYDTKVVLIAHVGDTVTYKEVHSFWIEDYPMNDDKIMVTYDMAYNKMMQANVVKPHSKYCILRKEVGPYACNPQYIFGNLEEQIYVDAVNGNVSAISPAFRPDTTNNHKLSAFINL